MDSLSLKPIQRSGLVLAAGCLLTACAASRAMPEATRNAADFATSPDGIRIAYEAHGEGPLAVVFVHGWSCNRTYWEGQLEPFSSEFKVVAVDLAGHGESGLGRENWTMAAFGGDVAAVIEKLDLRRVVLVGHSMGGNVIAETARLLPSRVLGLVWADTYRRLGVGRTAEEVQAFAAPFHDDFVESTRSLVRGMFLPGSDRSLVERVAMDMSAAPAAVALGAMEHSLSYGREMPQVLQELEMPVIAINPDSGPTDVVSMDRHGVEVVIMPGVGHFLMMEDPERFNRLLRTAIGRFVR